LRRKELLFFYQEGTSLLFPDAWEGYVEPIPEVERGDFMSAYHRRLTGTDEKEKLRCAKAWTTWEMYVWYVDSFDIQGNFKIDCRPCCS
jgi:proline iminopeptidase